MTATPEAEAALAATLTAALLRQAYEITHRIHHADTHGYQNDPTGARDVAGLRAVRDLIDAELLRRTAAHDMATTADLFIDSDGYTPTVWQADTAPGGEPLALTTQHALRNAGPLWDVLVALLPVRDLPPAT